MTRWLACSSFLFAIAAHDLGAQEATSALSPARASQAKPARALEKDPVKSMLSASDAGKNGPITTEIFADEAFFDSAKHMGVFTGHVIVNDPRFNVQADKLTIYLAKTPATPAGEKGAEAAPESGVAGQGLEKAVAEGNVGMVRERPGEKGGPPQRSVGRADTAIYTTSDGSVELRGTPRLQNGMNTHIATSPDTVMIIDQNGQLTTKGPSRTEIRQEPKASPSPAAAAAATPAKP